MRREFILTLDDHDRAVTIEPLEPGRWRLHVDGREHLVDAKQVRPGTWSLLVDGYSHTVDLDERPSGTAILTTWADALVEIADARHKRLTQMVSHQGTSRARGETLRAPIAGKVVKILVGPDDEVAANQGVAVIEAMKMENEIKCERGGKVATIHVEAGQSVENGEALVTLS